MHCCRSIKFRHSIGTCIRTFPKGIIVEEFEFRSPIHQTLWDYLRRAQAFCELWRSSGVSEISAQASPLSHWKRTEIYIEKAGDRNR